MKKTGGDRFYVYDQIRKSGDATPVVIEAEDTDVLITAAFVTTKICGVLGIKMKKGIFDCYQLLPRFMVEIQYRHVVGGIHAFCAPYKCAIGVCCMNGTCAMHACMM